MTLQLGGFRSLPMSAWILLLFLPASGCREPTPVPSLGSPAPSDVAMINGEAISIAEFEQFLAAEELSSQRVDERKEGLTRLIRQKVLAQEARKAGFESSTEEASRMGWSSNSADDSVPDYSLQHALDYIVIQKLVLNRLNADEEIELRTLLSHYEQNQAEYQIEDQYRVLEILVSDHSQADRFRRELQGGDFRQFREFAQTHSIGVGAEWGGDLGLFKRGELPIRFEEVIFALKVGEISEVFRSELGFHIFTIEELIPRHAQKFYEVQDQIFEQMVAEKEREELDQIVNQMMQSASIEIFDPILSRDWRKSDVQLP